MRKSSRVSIGIFPIGHPSEEDELGRLEDEEEYKTLGGKTTSSEKSIEPLPPTRLERLPDRCACWRARRRLSASRVMCRPPGPRARSIAPRRAARRKSTAHTGAAVGCPVLEPFPFHAPMPRTKHKHTPAINAQL